MSEEFQYIPSVPPEGLDPRMEEYLSREFENLYLSLHQKAGILGHDGSWNDLTGNLSAAKVTGASQPSWSVFRNGIYAHEFAAGTMNESWITIHIKHDYKQGSMIYPHVHWAPNGTNTGTCRWGIEYSIAKGYNQEAFPATSTIYIEQAGSGTTHMHQIAEPTEGNGIQDTSIEVDTLIAFRVFRDAAHANDTLTDTAFGLMVDVHYQVERFATPRRNTPFY